MSEPLKTELHHWWPKCVSQFWTDQDGMVTQLFWNGKEVRSQPKNFGAIKNAHHVKMGHPSGLWESSFETQFNKADNQFPDLIGWLDRLECRPLDANSYYKERFLPQPLSRQERYRLSECLASLITRSPHSRNTIKITVESYRYDLPENEREADKSLIAANMFHSYEPTVSRIAQRGKFAVLFSQETEFIFGEGFLHNFPVRAEGVFNPRCLIPLTPSVAILYASPLELRPKPALVTMKLTTDEVSLINCWVQTYSKDYVFYRTQKPEILEVFSTREFYQLPYHRNPWLDGLINELAMYQGKNNEA